MFNLIHNVDFLIAAIIFTIILSVGSNRLGSINKSNAAFFRLLYCLLFAAIADLLMNVCQTYTDVIPYIWSDISRFIYSSLLSILTAFAYQYVRSYQYAEDEVKTRDILDYLVVAATLIPCVLGIVNLFTGIMTYIDEAGNYQKGPLFLVNYVCPFIVLVFCLFTVFIHRSDYKMQQIRAIVSFVFIVLISELIEILINSKYLFGLFGCSLALVLIKTTLETPDYAELKNTLENLKKNSKELDNIKDINLQLSSDIERMNIELTASKDAANDARENAIKSARLAEEMRLSAVRANQSKNDFLSRVSHEFRTPLNTIIGNGDMIINESKDNVINLYAKDIIDASHSLLKLINDIFDFNKLENSKVSIEEEDYDFRAFLHRLYEFHQVRTKEKNLKLIFDIDENIPQKLLGDDVRLKQILDNLLINAVKYTNHGTVTLKVSLEGKGRASALIKFMVFDTGIGIKEEEISKLYDDINKVDNKETKYSDGMGLGLSIVNRLLLIMGSKLSIDSVYGLGSQFSFSIRQSYMDESPIGDFMAFVDKDKEIKRLNDEINTKEVIAIKAPNANVLVVDDNSMNIKVFMGLLKETGIKIAAATSGMDAVMYAEKQHFDMIYLDHMMPKMDGLETLNQIRNSESSLNKDTAIIALVANAINGAYEEYLGYGFNDVVFKPTTQDELYKSLYKYLPKDLIEN